MKTMFNNILKNQKNPQYKSINLKNEKFHQKVGQFHTAIELYTLLGFEP